MTDVEDGALAYTRITDTFHLLYGRDGIEALLYWLDSEMGEVVTSIHGRTGEPRIFSPSANT